MEMKLVTSLEELENIREKHAVIVVSDGKIQVVSFQHTAMCKLSVRTKRQNESKYKQKHNYKYVLPDDWRTQIDRLIPVSLCPPFLFLLKGLTT